MCVRTRASVEVRGELAGLVLFFTVWTLWVTHRLSGLMASTFTHSAISRFQPQSFSQ